jgi:ATP-dependent RNA helicase DDX27
MVLVPTRELAIQIHSVAKSLAKFTKVEFCLATGENATLAYFCLHLLSLQI